MRTHTHTHTELQRSTNWIPHLNRKWTITLVAKPRRIRMALLFLGFCSSVHWATYVVAGHSMGPHRNHWPLSRHLNRRRQIARQPAKPA